MTATLPCNTDRPTLVLVAFGTSVEHARKVYDHIYTEAQKRFAQYDIEWAFTSQVIINKLEKQGIVTRNVQDVVSDLRERGVKKVVFQSFHVVPGQEYSRVKQVDMSGFEVAYGDALLTADDDIDAVIRALEKDIDPQQATVIVTHGNDRYPEFNQQILAFSAKIESQNLNLVVASVEGSPGTDPLQKAKPVAQQTGSVRFVPLMVVAGDHIMNDVMGEEEDSWKSIVQAPQSECLPSLGWNNNVLEIYFSHLDRAIEQL